MNSGLVSGRGKKPYVLLILDGLGISDLTEGNAVKLAKTPNLEYLKKTFPSTYLQASGLYVGLPDGVMGNSEVGHMSLGAGRILFQELAKINHEIDSGSFMKNETFHEAVRHAKKHKSNLHLMGLVSDGQVHSSMKHLEASLRFCRKNGLKRDRVKIHVFTDGRDTSRDSALEYLELLNKWIKKYKVGVIASIIGRYYAMDRDERWDRTKLAYDLIVNGIGEKVKDCKKAIELSYDKNIFDEYIAPFVIVDKKGRAVGAVEDSDVVIFFNYRADRAVQLSQAFEIPGFSKFETKPLENLYFVGFSNYEKGLPMARSDEDIAEVGDESKFVQEYFKEEVKKTEHFPEKQIFPPDRAEKSLGKIISDAGLSQLRLAESEKYPHVTYFFSCRNKEPFEREDRIEIPSPRDVKTYDQKPEMSTFEITETFKREIATKKHDFIFVNFALTDMVAHTGNLEASIKAVEIADKCMGEMVKATLEVGGELMITADHGNIEELVNIRTQEIDTKHSTNPVPVYFVGNELKGARQLPDGILADVAPTILARMGIDQPEEMKGRNLLG